jgi:succinyl-diaminopimelate desuccinylase
LSQQDQISRARGELIESVRAACDYLVEITRQLLHVSSENPPGDTSAVAAVAAEILAAEGAKIELVTSEAPIVNVVARVLGARPGRRLVYNGHLDTYPVGDLSRWSVNPFSGAVHDGRLYGRGAADMKGGIACSILAFLLLARMRDTWAGEVVVTLAGDEESMGTRGTQFLLDHFEYSRGDAMITGDAGSPEVLRFGEKGMLWLEIEARGRAAHGAHVHLGVNAVERLIRALGEVFALREMPVHIPSDVDEVIRAASTVSEAISGNGETHTLRHVTVNCGLFRGGTLPNVMPDEANAALDIRLPAGTTSADVEARLAGILAAHEGVNYRITRRYEPQWSDPHHELVGLLAKAGEEILGRRPVANYRVGASDARLYRQWGVPAFVCGLTPNHMGAADEFVDVEELFAVAFMHTLAGFDYLTADAGSFR